MASLAEPTGHTAQGDLFGRGKRLWHSPGRPPKLPR